MHASVKQWVPAVLADAGIAGLTVLEVGAFDVNGSVRSVLSELGPATYVGVDQRRGRGVDVVCDAERLVERFGPDAFDVVICAEMLEHVEQWQIAVARMVDVVKRGGMLVLTTRSKGFPYHGFPDDFWRFSVAGMRQIVKRCGLVDAEVLPDPDWPGVFAHARKPHGWVEPWSSDPLARVAGVTPVRRP